jgi:hypothetical protein
MKMGAESHSGISFSLRGGGGVRLKGTQEFIHVSMSGDVFSCASTYRKKPSSPISAWDFSTPLGT